MPQIAKSYSDGGYSYDVDLLPDDKHGYKSFAVKNEQELLLCVAVVQPWSPQPKARNFTLCEEPVCLRVHIVGRNGKPSLHPEKSRLFMVEPNASILKAAGV